MASTFRAHDDRRALNLTNTTQLDAVGVNVAPDSARLVAPQLQLRDLIAMHFIRPIRKP
jgi:hypothetical protein